jgi:23S rRNA pseudouridine2605 synthase
MLIRLNKYISDCGLASRRKAEEFILTGRVIVNKNVITDLSFKVDDSTDTVLLDGEKIALKKHLYFLLNKPKGVVTTTEDDKKRLTVVDLIKTREKIYPVGRLDFNTTGILFLTNDGDFSNILTHPRNRVPRVYEVHISTPLSDDDEKALLKGVYIDGVKGVFTKIFFPKSANRKFMEVTGIEGRNHFVKNMFSTLGYTVNDLNRKSYAGIIADIPVGSYRNLSVEEVQFIIKKYGR